MKIAIIGSGISGLGAAYLLSERHDIMLFEKNGYTGGHSRTVTIDTPDGAVDVDTGFIVFNKRNYPHLTAMLDLLDVPIIKSTMSFGVSIDHGWLEYGTASLKHCFAQKQNLIRPKYLAMLSDIGKFYKKAHIQKHEMNDVSLGSWIDSLKLGRWFRDYFLLPMGGAIWSMPPSQMLDYPARTFLRFFDNHGLLGLYDAPQWYTIKGGSKKYVTSLTARFKDKIKLSCAANRVIRNDDGIVVFDVQGGRQKFDQLIFACHSDEVMQLLEEPTAKEHRLLSAIKYNDNVMILHSDISLMPKRKQAWSSWVYLSDHRDNQSGQISISYWMNNLQFLGTHHPVIVTLNPPTMPQADKIFDQAILAHPQFDQLAIEAQAQIEQIQGKHKIWYCGAWQRYGFHEDGLLSAVNIAKKMGASVPWAC